MPTSRRFPPPWSVEETAACFIVRDHRGQKLAYAYCEEEPGRLSPTQRRSCISSGRGDHMIGRTWLVTRPIGMASRLATRVTLVRSTRVAASGKLFTAGSRIGRKIGLRSPNRATGARPVAIALIGIIRMGRTMGVVDVAFLAAR
jgi:hypothetical protein